MTEENNKSIFARFEEYQSKVNTTNELGRRIKKELESELENEPYEYHLYVEQRFEELCFWELRKIRKLLEFTNTVELVANMEETLANETEVIRGDDSDKPHTTPRKKRR